MKGKVLYLRDYEQRSREPDAVDRDPAEALIIILPAVRIERDPDRPVVPCGREWRPWETVY